MFSRVFALSAPSPVYGSPIGPIQTVLAETQRVSEWCWLAVASSVDRHYGGTSTQCDLANDLQNQTACCAEPASVDCNRQGSVGRALAHLHRLNRIELIDLNDPGVRIRIRHELEVGRPPAAQFEFSGSGEHVVLLAGFGWDAAGVLLLRIGDPALGWNAVDLIYSQAHNYRGGVTWHHAFWTEP